MALRTVTPQADTALARSPASFLLAFGGTVLGLFLVFALMERLGIPPGPISHAAIFIPLVLYGVIGLRARTLHRATFFTGDRTVPPISNAMAMAANGVSGLVFIGLVGTLYARGYDGFAYSLGWAGGFFLVAVVIAPQLRKARADTAPDFFAARFEGPVARLVAVGILVACSAPLLIAQMTAFGTVLSRFLDLSFETAVLIGFALILSTILLGGMHGLTWTQVAQYLVIAAALVVPIIWMSIDIAGNPVPQAVIGEAAKASAALERSMEGSVSAALGSLLTPDHAVTLDGFNFLALTLVLAAGTAAFPHILTRSQTAPGVRQTRRSLAWALVFFAVLLLAVPAYAILVRYELLSTIAGLRVDDLPGNAAWIFRWGASEGEALVALCGQKADALQAVIAACGGADHIVMPADIVLSEGAVTLAGPEIAGLPRVVSALVALGAISALLAMSNGLLFALGTALGHDLYAELGDRKAPPPRRLYITRLALIGTTGLAAYAVLKQPVDILAAAAWSFSLAAAGLFPALVLGIWWKRTTAVGAVGGMITGSLITVAYLIVNIWGIDMIKASGDEIVWSLPGFTDAVLPINAGIFGIPVGFATVILLSLMTPAPEDRSTPLLTILRDPAAHLFRKRTQS